MDDRVHLQAFDRVQQCRLIHDVDDQGLRAEGTKLVASARSAADADHLVSSREQLAGQRGAQGEVRIAFCFIRAPFLVSGNSFCNAHRI